MGCVNVGRYFPKQLAVCYLLFNVTISGSENVAWNDRFIRQQSIENDLKVVVVA